MKSISLISRLLSGELMGQHESSSIVRSHNVIQQCDRTMSLALIGLVLIQYYWKHHQWDTGMTLIFSEYYSAHFRMVI